MAAFGWGLVFASFFIPGTVGWVIWGFGMGLGFFGVLVWD